MTANTVESPVAKGAVAHTPGPWCVGSAYSDAPVSTMVYDVENDAIIAHCFPHKGVSAETREANARLIAAAPDMLAALRGLMAYSHAAAYALEHSRPETAEGLRVADEYAKAVIAKAEGRS